MAPGWQGRTAIENTDVVKTQESTLEDVFPLGILSIHPPREVEHQLVENALQELAITCPFALFLDLVNAPCRPRVHGRVDVAKGPLVCRNLTVRMHVPFAQQENELLLRKVAIDESQRNAVKGEIPGGVPGIFPFVRH